MSEERRKLEAEAERLRAERLGKQQREAAQLDLRRGTHESEGFGGEQRMRKSVSRHTAPLIFVMVLIAVGALTALFFAEAGADHSLEAMVLGVSVLTMGVLFYWRSTAISRYQKWLEGLPFQLQNLTPLLRSSSAVIRVEATVRFSDTASDLGVLQELVLARLEAPSDPDDPPRFAQAGRDLTVSQGLSTETANWPLWNWASALTEKVLRDLHRGYPVASVTFAAISTSEFHVPSGD